VADFVLETRVWLPRPRPEVFAFFADAKNLARVNPKAAALSWRRSPPDVLFAGAVLDFSVRVLVARMRWRVLIREFDPPYRFVDVQVRGPFARWEHRHRFVEGLADPDRGGPSGTWVEDRVTYRPPFGPLGRLLHTLGGRRQLAAIFAHRQHRLTEIFGSTA